MGHLVILDIYIYIYTHTHIYIYIYTHTHIYIYIWKHGDFMENISEICDSDFLGNIYMNHSPYRRPLGIHFPLDFCWLWTDINSINKAFRNLPIRNLTAVGPRQTAGQIAEAAGTRDDGNSMETYREHKKMETTKEKLDLSSFVFIWSPLVDGWGP